MMPHWRTQVSRDNPNLHWWDIQGHSPIKLTIASHQMGKTFGDDGEQKMMSFLSFKGAKKPFGLNVTNAHIIGQLHGDDMDFWIGKEIVLRTAECKRLPCIRVHAPQGTKIPGRLPRFKYTDREENTNERPKQSAIKAHEAQGAKTTATTQGQGNAA